MFEFDESLDQRAVIKVVGVAGRGCKVINALNGADIDNVELIAIDTDVQSLKLSHSPTKILVGTEMAEEKKMSLEERKEIVKILHAADMVVVVCDLNDTVDINIAQIVAEEACETGALTIVVGIKVASSHCADRINQQESRIEKLISTVDSLSVINSSLFADGRACKFGSEVELATHVIMMITGLIVKQSLMCVDLADVKFIMQQSGVFRVGVGAAEGKGRAERAASQAVSFFDEDVNLIEAKGVLAVISGSRKLTMEDFDVASKIVHDQLHEDTNIIVGMDIDEKLDKEVAVTVIATSFGC